MSLKVIEKEKRKETVLLEKIQNLLPNEIICIIYDYMSGNAKFQYNKKYEFIKEKIQFDVKNHFAFYKSLQNIFETENACKIKLWNYINTIIIPNHSLIIKNLWYISKESENHYKGMDLLNRWNQDILDIKYYQDSRKVINNIIKKRFSDGIYYYIRRSVEVYETMKKKDNYSFSDASNMFIKMDKIHRLVQSFSLLSNKMVYTNEDLN
jgi:hypothetical protein